MPENETVPVNSGNTADVNATPTPVITDNLPSDPTTVDYTYYTDPDTTGGIIDPVRSSILAGYAPTVSMSSTAALSDDYPLDNDGNEENYVHAAPYFGQAKRISHDTDNIAFRVYDYDYNPEAPKYGVFVDNVFTEAVTMVVGDAKKFEVRARTTQTTPPQEEGEDPVVTAVNSWTDDIPGMIWVSQDEEKAIIREGNQVYAIAPGSVTIKVFNTNENAFSAKIVITIVEADSTNNSFTIDV